MMIGCRRRRIYQEPLSRALGLLAIHRIFMNHACVFSLHNPCLQICAPFHTRLINEGLCDYAEQITI